MQTKKEEPKPHSFCETPEEKCAMNYCDENGCQNRKKILVEEPNLSSLELKLDEALSKETEESLTTWLQEKRSKQELERGITITHVGKQETLEEAKDRKYPLTNIMHFQLNTAIRTGFEEGAKWQQEQNNNKYSEQDIVDFLDWIGINDYRYYSNGWATMFSKPSLTPKQLFKKFKNK